MLHIYYLDENNKEKYYCGENNPEHLRNSYLNRVSINKIHRKNGPAYYNDDNSVIEYFEDGFNHRLDGPASILDYFRTGFYINGKRFIKSSFAEETNHLICNSCDDFCKQACF